MAWACVRAGRWGAWMGPDGPVGRLGSGGPDASGPADGCKARRTGDSPGGCVGSGGPGASGMAKVRRATGRGRQAVSADSSMPSSRASASSVQRSIVARGSGPS